MATVRKSAGILLYRYRAKQLELFLVHPGGPFFAKKDAGSWTIPKGEFLENEEALDVALREFFEETGTPLSGDFITLTPVKQKGGKTVQAFATEGDLDPATLVSNTFTIEWPPKSGRQRSFPEVDKGEWFTPAAAKDKINPAQIAFIDELEAHLAQQES